MHKNVKMFAVAIAAAFLIAACGQQPTEEAGTMEEPMAVDIAAEEAALQTMVQEYTAAWNAHDAAGVAEFWTEDGEFWPDDGPRVVGRDAYTSSLETTFAEMPDAAIEIIAESFAVSPSGDMAIGKGTYSVSGTVEGEATSGEWQWGAGYAKVDGQWLVTGVIANSGVAAEEAAEETME